MSSSGALSPQKAAEDTLEIGKHHLSEALQLTFLKSIYGGLLLSAGGVLSLILVTGTPTLTESNPGIARVLQGITFPVGLVLVYFTGAELMTGYPMWYTHPFDTLIALLRISFQVHHDCFEPARPSIAIYPWLYSFMDR